MRIEPARALLDQCGTGFSYITGEKDLSEG
jgi:hypothetical protein